MKILLKTSALWVWWLLAPVLLMAADERPVVPAAASVYVRYQYRSVGGAWASSGTTLKGAISESMMLNQLSRRHPGKEVRVLSAKVGGKSRRVSVRYQLRKGEGAWSSGSTTLQDALTESMARNQLSARHPGMEIRVLSMTPQ